MVLLTAGASGGEREGGRGIEKDREGEGEREREGGRTDLPSEVPGDFSDVSRKCLGGVSEVLQ